ncbi:MAG: DUF262 domain-containing protein [Methylotenera sp.]|nr:DUF262 domain-containing protein [Methylotenera sp.]MDD4926990.1 DUF262 domain-containing protein [Methylotenera sp.]
MSIIDKKIATLKDVLILSLTIPNYQRPYKWTDVQANQLVDDILHHMRIGKKKYRLGTIVLHQTPNEKTLNIVDGQQRLLTLSMLCHYLGAELDVKLLKANFQSISLENLQHNAAHLKRRVERLSDDEKKQLSNFFLEKCELVCVTLNDISEAFQFFDSQNARGKSLEAYDLLKAFHLREMEQASTDEVNYCVEHWEQRATTDGDIQPKLKTIINDVLFPIRHWLRGETAIEFKNEDVRVFKGVNFKNHHYPYIVPLRAIEHAAVGYNAEIIRIWGGKAMDDFPYQSTQVLVNGKRFFDYIKHYAELYQKLFIKRHKELKKFLDVLDSYSGRHRTGDLYVKKLFFCTVMYYYDKFGEYGFDSAVSVCFQWSYRLRLEKSRVQVESINNHAIEPLGLLRCISNATHPDEVLNFSSSPIEKIEATRVDELKQFFEIKAEK